MIIGNLDIISDVQKVDPVSDRASVFIISFLFLYGLYLIMDYFFFFDVSDWRKTAFIMASVILIIGGMEMAMTAFSIRFPRIHRHSSTLLWELAPNLKKVIESGGRYRVTTNSHGFRSREISRKKPSGQVRVMLIGDSAAFGWPLEDNENFSYFLQKMLKKEFPNRDMRVINAAVCGYSSCQAREFMKERGWEFQPDFLIVSFNNDCFMEVEEDSKRIAFSASKHFSKYLYKINLFIFLKDLSGKGRINPDDDIITSAIDGKPRVSKKELEEVYEYFMLEAKKRDIGLMVISMPVKGPLKDYPGLQEYRKIMKNMALSSGFSHLDLFSLWQGEEYENLLLDTMHPTAAGHKKIAREIFDILKEIPVKK